MLPVDAVFRRFPRLVRDLSSRLGKQVRCASAKAPNWTRA